MRIRRSAIIIYSGSNKKKGMKDAKLITYKNERYLEMMKTLLDEYDEIITVDINDACLNELDNKETEEKVIKNIYKALKSASNDKCLVISLSMPLVSKNLVNYMGTIKFEEDVLIPYTSNELQKLCAVYDKKVLNKIEDIIESKNISFKSLFDNISIRYIFPKDESMFINIDKLEKYITYYM